MLINSNCFTSMDCVCVSMFMSMVCVCVWMDKKNGSTSCWTGFISLIIIIIKIFSFLFLLFWRPVTSQIHLILIFPEPNLIDRFPTFSLKQKFHLSFLLLLLFNWIRICIPYSCSESMSLLLLCWLLCWIIEIIQQWYMMIMKWKLNWKFKQRRPKQTNKQTDAN